MTSCKSRQDTHLRSLSWSEVFSSLLDDRSFSPLQLTRRINRRGELVIDMSNDSDDRQRVASSLIDHVHPSYRSILSAWLKAHIIEHAEELVELKSTVLSTVLCPLYLFPTTTKTSWFELRLTAPNILSIIELSETLNRMRLSARSAGFIGFKHDLANRLFLFKALPELLEFSEPKELLDDVGEELPRLLSFLEDRLSKRIGGVSIERYPTKYRLINALQSEVFDRLAKDQEVNSTLKFEMTLNESSKALQDTGTIGQCERSLIDLEWSLRYLAKLLKRRMLQSDSTPHTLSLREISYVPRTEWDQSLLGLGNTLPSDDTTLCLSLDLRGLINVSLAESAELWSRQEFLNTDRSDLSLEDPSSPLTLSAWLDSWISAGISLKGAVYIVDEQILEIRF